MRESRTVNHARQYTQAMVDILAAPFDGGGARLGSRLGPEALEARGLRVASWVDLPNPAPNPALPGLRAFDACLTAVTDLRKAALTSLGAGHMPLVVGGEHSI